MKKVYIAVACAMIGSAAIAQHAQMPNAPEKVTNSQLKVGNPAFRAQSGNRAGVWMNYALELDDPNGYTPGMAAGDFLNIFPDSTIILGQYTDGSTAYAQFHKAACMADPKNMPLGMSSFNSAQNYTLDSIAIAYAYLRATPTNITDTLQIQIIKHDASLEWTLSSSSITYQDITYVQSSNTITQSQVLASYNYLLTENDSSNYVSEIAIATPTVASQTGTNRIGVVISFKPGYTWTPLVDSLNDKNGFYIYSYEQNGASTDPTYYGTTGVTTSDMNCSYELPTDVRYDQNANGWNGYFIPTWAWTTPFTTEHHIISFLINQATGINENSVVSLGDMYPNPTTGVSTIDYALQNEAEVSIEISDVTGKVVLSQREGNKPAGAYKTTIDLQNLANGTYFATIRANDAKQVKRLVVAK